METNVGLLALQVSLLHSERGSPTASQLARQWHQTHRTGEEECGEAVKTQHDPLLYLRQGEKQAMVFSRGTKWPNNGTIKSDLINYLFILLEKQTEIFCHVGSLPQMPTKVRADGPG